MLAQATRYSLRSGSRSRCAGCGFPGALGLIDVDAVDELPQELAGSGQLFAESGVFRFQLRRILVAQLHGPLIADFARGVVPAELFVEPGDGLATGNGF